MIDPDTWWEAGWIRELLSSDRYEIIEDVDMCGFSCFDNAIYVTSFHLDIRNYEQFFDKLDRNGCKYGIIHLSDEGYSASTSCYSKAQFVLRNYWHKKFAGEPKIITIPLGYKTNFWTNCSDKKIGSVLQRRYNWSFAGQIDKTTRKSMIQNMQKIEKSFIHNIDSFNAADSLPIGQYRDILLESIFVPCPRGWWNLDSFRVYEALECGCIPIVEKSPFDYFAKSLGSYPFLSVNSWDEIPQLLNEDLLSDSEKLEQLRQRCYHWWIAYKNQLKEKIADVICESF